MIGVFWALLAGILFAAQFAFGVFDLLFPAIAALVTALAASLIPGFGPLIGLQVPLWIAASFFAVVAFRKRFKHLFKGDVIKLERSLHAGKRVKVVETVSPESPGRISFQGTTWTATTLDETISAGSSAYILEQNGMQFLVGSRLLDDEPERQALPESSDDKDSRE